MRPFVAAGGGVIRARPGAGGSADDVRQRGAGVDCVLRGTFTKLRHWSDREELAKSLSEPMQNALKPLLTEVAGVRERIGEYDEQIENIRTSRDPETALLKQVYGIGTLTALTM